MHGIWSQVISHLELSLIIASLETNIGHFLILIRVYHLSWDNPLLQRQVGKSKEPLFVTMV